jgi:CRP/FNR family cyclic AMP-dependent transcriptional regulator
MKTNQSVQGGEIRCRSPIRQPLLPVHNLMVHPQRELLQNISVFGALSADTLDFLLQRSTVITCPKGEFFFREGDQAQSVYILETGRVAVLKHWQERDYLLKHLEPGACFGEMALMDMYPRSASVRAETDSSACKISSAALLDLYQHDLEQFTLLQMNLGREVSRRLREADERLFRMQREAEAREHESSLVLRS